MRPTSAVFSSEDHIKRSLPSSFAFGKFFKVFFLNQVYTQPCTHWHIAATPLLAVVQVTQPGVDSVLVLCTGSVDTVYLVPSTLNKFTRTEYLECISPWHSFQTLSFHSTFHFFRLLFSTEYFYLQITTKPLIKSQEGSVSYTSPTATSLIFCCISFIASKSVQTLSVLSLNNAADLPNLYVIAWFADCLFKMPGYFPMCTSASGSFVVCSIVLIIHYSRQQTSMKHQNITLERNSIGLYKTTRHSR